MTGVKEYWSQIYAARSCPWFTRVISQRLGAIVAWFAESINISPNQLTLVGLPLSVIAAFNLALIDTPSAALGTCLLLQAVYVIDCADGQLARATKSQTAFGGWLDVAVDHARNVMLSVALIYLLAVSTGSLALGCIAGVVYGMGVTVGLHAIAQLKSGQQQGASRDEGSRLSLRNLVKNCTDSPVTFIGFCLLAFYPNFLAIYSILIGLMMLASASFIAIGRLRESEQENYS